ncbi:MAG: alpha/beta fold hydrolase [Myxococcota bacterium]
MRACLHDEVLTNGFSRLIRFRGAAAPGSSTPLLLVPSLINRWYVLDLYDRGSVAKAFVEGGIDTYLLDWGVANDEDRYFGWDDAVSRLHRMVRAVRRFTGAERVGLLGYCVGGTLSAIHTALEPDTVCALANLAGPIDFSHGGMLRDLVDARWFDPAAVASAGNVRSQQMQAGFIALRPTGQISKYVAMLDKMSDPKAKAAFDALEGWASDNIPFPAAAYRQYITDMYQRNLLVQGEHYVGPRRVDLGRITCPTAIIVAERDHICPPEAALALDATSNAAEKEVIRIPGGHVGAVVGSKARTLLYPQITAWFARHLGVSASTPVTTPAAALPS